MMITLRKLPLAVAVAAGVMSAQAMAVDFHGYAFYSRLRYGSHDDGSQHFRTDYNSIWRKSAVGRGCMLCGLPVLRIL